MSFGIQLPPTQVPLDNTRGESASFLIIQQSNEMIEMIEMMI